MGGLDFCPSVGERSVGCFMVRSVMSCFRKEKDGLDHSAGRGESRGRRRPPRWRGYLVDPASSHMLVSKTKSCMSECKRFCTVKLRMAH